MKNLPLLFLIVLILSCSETKQKEFFPVLNGPYLGQKTPSDSALLFAPGIVSAGMNDRDIAITPEGDEIFFTRNIGNFKYATIFYSKLENGIWTKPEVPDFATNPRYKFIEPCISPDGKKLFFASDMPADGGEPSSMEIWVVDKKDGKWGSSYNIGAPINTNSDQYFPSVTNDGTLYFTSEDSVTNEEFIYRSKIVNGVYQQPELLPKNVNMGLARFNAFISPDESFLIVPAFGMPDTYGATDYYVVFRDENDKWGTPINMGLSVNSANGQEWSASLSPDGNYLFFMSAKSPANTQSICQLSSVTFDELNNSFQNGNSDIYWINAEFIKKLK